MSAGKIEVIVSFRLTADAKTAAALLEKQGSTLAAFLAAAEDDMRADLDDALPASDWEPVFKRSEFDIKVTAGES